jgi:hypothetical protein
VIFLNNKLKGTDMRLIGIAAMFFLAICSQAGAQSSTPHKSKTVIEKMGPTEVDGGHTGCSSGKELKGDQEFTATEDRFFQNIKVIMVSGWSVHGAPVCALTNIKTKKVISKTADGYELTTDMPYKYTVHWYSDCGTDPIKYTGKTISVECQTQAEYVKFTDE